jgi:hypothetical protein
MVACNPILTQEISNGHAARMRYSRFRSAILNLEPTRRNRTGAAKSRVTKPKKDGKAKKEDKVKSEPALGPPSPQESIKTPISKVKREGLKHHTLPERLTPGSTPCVTPDPTIMPASHAIQTRLMTPSSDNDFSPSTLINSPSGEMINSQNPYDFQATSCQTHDDSGWNPADPYSAFSTMYPFDGIGTPTCDHQHLYHQHDHLGLLNTSIEGNGDHTDVKHEAWSRGI